MPSKGLVSPQNWRVRVAGKRMSFPRIRLVDEVEVGAQVGYLYPDLVPLNRRLRLMKGELVVKHVYLLKNSRNVVECYDLQLFGKARFARIVCSPIANTVSSVSEMQVQRCRCYRIWGNKGWLFFYGDSPQLPDLLQNLQPSQELLPSGNGRMWRKGVLNKKTLNVVTFSVSERL